MRSFDNFLSLFLPVFVFLCFPGFGETQAVCGTAGAHDYNSIQYYMGNFFWKSPSILGLCTSFCKADTRCQSFRYMVDTYTGSQYCDFFASRTSSYFIPEGASRYNYYDVDCGSLPQFGNTVSNTVVAMQTSTRLQTITVFQTVTTTQILTLITTSWSRTLTKSSILSRTVTSTKVKTVTARPSTVTVTRTRG